MYNIFEDQNIYYTESATLYRKIAINYIESVRNYINNDFKEFIDRIDEVKKIYIDEYNRMDSFVRGGTR